ncbi:MAG TPA: hypothetical protein VK625_05820, partial [Flavitalea sp.]|nr:hypothetical protein [Flavitalea sp.]
MDLQVRTVQWISRSVDFQSCLVINLIRLSTSADLEVHTTMSADLEVHTTRADEDVRATNHEDK